MQAMLPTWLTVASVPSSMGNNCASRKHIMQRQSQPKQGKEQKVNIEIEVLFFPLFLPCFPFALFAVPLPVETPEIKEKMQFNKQNQHQLVSHLQ